MSEFKKPEAYKNIHVTDGKTKAPHLKSSSADSQGFVSMVWNYLSPAK